MLKPDEDRNDVAARAADARERILAEVKAGRFQLAHSAGYLNGGPQQKCWGCALGALAFTLCNVRNLGFGLGLREMVEQVVETGAVTLNDTRQLEMGFEDWGHFEVTAGGALAADPTHPFHQLGQELSVIAQTRPDQPW